MRQEFSGSAAPKFFEFLRKLACDAEFSLRQDAGAGSERLQNSIRRFEEDRCFFTIRRGAQFSFALAAFNREKSAKEEFLGRKSGTN